MANVFHEQRHEDVAFVMAGIHPTTQEEVGASLRPATISFPRLQAKATEEHATLKEIYANE